MKKYLLSLTILSIFSCAQAQPTLDFEAWNTSSPPDPQDWTSTNILVPFGNDTVCHKAAFPNSFTGNYAMKLETIKLNSNLLAANGVPDTVCFAFTGKIIVTFAGGSLKPGYAFTARPNAFYFMYKYSPSPGDSASAGVFLTKWNGTSRDTVAIGRITMGSNSTYSYDSIPLTYTPAYFTSGNPDSANIFFASSNIRSINITPAGGLIMKYNSVKIGSLLWVDNISSTGYSVGINENLNAIQEIYPNPANEFFKLEFNNNQNRKILIYDNFGKMIESHETDYKNLIINTSRFSNGIYQLIILTNAGQECTRKIIVSH